MTTRKPAFARAALSGCWYFVTRWRSDGSAQTKHLVNEDIKRILRDEGHDVFRDRYEKRARNALALLPDGTWMFIDSTGREGWDVDEAIRELVNDLKTGRQQLA